MCGLYPAWLDGEFRKLKSICLKVAKAKKHCLKSLSCLKGFWQSVLTFGINFTNKRYVCFKKNTLCNKMLFVTEPASSSGKYWMHELVFSRCSNIKACSTGISSPQIVPVRNYFMCSLNLMQKGNKTFSLALLYARLPNNFTSPKWGCNVM